MKTIGIIGGLSWHSSAKYYERINQGVHDALGGQNSAQLILSSVNREDFVAKIKAGKHDELYGMIHEKVQGLVRAGIDGLLIATNTGHIHAEKLQTELDIPLLHIADATAEAIKDRGLNKIALLGTRATMELDFYKGRLTEKHAIDVLVPDANGIEQVDHIIQNELTIGQVKETSKTIYLDIIRDLVTQGAQGVILGCTEIGLLVKQDDLDIPAFDTTEIHCDAAVKFMLDD